MLISKMAYTFVAQLNLQEDSQVRMEMLEKFLKNPKRLTYNVLEDSTFVYKKANLTPEEQLFVLDHMFSQPPYKAIHGPIYRLLNQDQLDFVINKIQTGDTYHYIFHCQLMAIRKIKLTLSQKQTLAKLVMECQKDYPICNQHYPEVFEALGL